MIIPKSKKYKKILSFISLTIVAIFFCVVNVNADEYNGSGTASVGCKGQSNCFCNQGSSQLCIWDVKNHVILEVALYYFPSKTGLNGGVRIYDSKIYANGNISYYTGMGFFSGKTIYPLSGFPTNTRGGISAPAKSFFYDNIGNFRQLFKNITGVSLASDDANNTLLKNWMTQYCKTHGYGNTLPECHQSTGGTKGFRIVIQPILTGLYGSSNSVRVGTVKNIFGTYDVWNSNDTKIGVSTAMYLNRNDIGFSAGQASYYAGASTVASDSSGYGLNMFTWPVDVPDTTSPCNPATDGVKYCCDLYDIEYSSDAANHDSTKIKTPMTQSQLNNAGCHKIPVDTCKNEYVFTKTVPSTCATGVNGLVSDSASWKCVFTSTQSNRDTTVKNNYLFSSFSNKYCSIYCEEKIEYTLPNTGAYADAGTYFTITNASGYQKIGPISYKGTSTCRVTSQTSSDDGIIDVAQFVSDFKAADRAVLVAYDNWQYAELQNEVINNATSHSWSRTCTDRWCTGYSTRTTCSGSGATRSCSTSTYCSSHDSCSASRSGTYYTYNNKTYSGATFSRSTGISDGSCGCTSRCGSSCTSKVSLKNVGSLKAIYEQAIVDRDNLLAELKRCNNFYKTYKEFKPNVTFTYDDVLYKNTYTLKPTGSASSSTEYFSSGNSTGSKNTSTLTYSNSVRSDASNETATYNTDSTSVRGYSSLITYWNCGHGVTKTGCSTTSQFLYPINNWFEQTTVRNYSYTLPDGINNYVDKPSGFSSSTPTANYDYVPFSNLPIHFSTQPGDYNYYINTTTYGTNNKFNSYIIGTTNFNNVSYHSDTKFNCTYKISKDKTIICVTGTNDPACSVTDGSDLIYRPISLYYPFPGQNATTVNLRPAGKNWATASGTDAISKYIYNNRGVSYYELYKLQPMYEVTLTPALMRKIQQYNTSRSNTKEWYYKGTAKQVFATVGYSDFTLDCKTKPDGSKAGQCTSSIIRSWGVKGCAISGSGYTKCGNTIAW
jgi:hypothetical protein